MDGSPKHAGLNARTFLRDLVIALAVVLALVAGTTRWIAIPWVVRGSSMEPTLWDGDRVIVGLAVFRTRDPRPRDVVMLLGPGDVALVKRVAREPLAADASYPEAVLTPDSALEPTYPVLGDNPSESSDSRMFGRVPRHRIQGRVLWRYWPPSRGGRIE